MNKWIPDIGDLVEITFDGHTWVKTQIASINRTYEYFITELDVTMYAFNANTWRFPNKPEIQGDRFNANKPRPSLLSVVATDGLLDVLEAGARKYGKDNWKKGLPYEEILDSLERHLRAIRRGELYDAESGLPHIDHLGANWMFYSHFFNLERDDNDQG